MIAIALPTVFMPNLVDAFILPRASLVIAGACLGAGLALLIPAKPGLGRLKWPLITAVGAALLAFALSVSWPLSFVGGYTRYESLPMRIAYLGLLAVPAWLLRDERSRRSVLAAFVLGTAIASIEAIWQQYTNAPFRPDGNVGNAGLLGGLIALALPISVAGSFRRGPFVVAWWLAVLVLAAGLYASTSRAGGLGAYAGCVAVLVLRFRGRDALVAALLATASVAFGLILIVVSPLRFLNGDPGPTRIRLWGDALHLIGARPVSGWGEDTTGLVLGRFLTGQWAAANVTFDRVHSGLLDLATTQGVIGVLAIGSVLAVATLGAWRHRTFGSVTPVLAACIGYSVWVLFNFDWAPATGAFWLLAGTGWSAILAAERGGVEPESAVHGHWTYPRRVAGAVALALVATMLAALPILAEAWYSQGRPDLAVKVDPLQVQYHRALGEELVARGSRADGLRELQLAASLGATDPALYVELGDEELRSGDVAKARAAYRTALTIDPFWAPAKQRLAANGGLGTA